MDIEKNDPGNHFTGKVVFGAALTITVEYDLAALAGHLADWAILRMFAPEGINGQRLIDRNVQENSITLTEKWRVEQGSVDSPQQIARELLVAHVAPEEQEEYRKEAEKLAAQNMELIVRLDLTANLLTLAHLSIADAVEATLKYGPISAKRYDELTRIKLFGLQRRGQGGANRKSKNFKTEDEIKQFASKTEELRPLWEYITAYFERNDYDAGCAESVRLQEHFRELSEPCLEVSNDLLKDVFRRKSEGGEKLWPIAFALKHACHELNIINKNDKTPSYWTTAVTKSVLAG
jgi:hypothetical protein